MTRKRKNIDELEADILKDFESGNFKSVSDHEKLKIEAEAAAAQSIKRDSRINIRISSADLNQVRRIAAEEGLPYQTLLASVIHKFASGRLIDVKSHQS